MLTQSALVIATYQDRRFALAEALRAVDFVVVDATTLQQGAAILRQFRFDVLVLDSWGSGDGLLEIVHDLRAENRELGILLSGPSPNAHWLNRLRVAGLIGSAAEPLARRIAPGFDTASPSSHGSQCPRDDRQPSTRNVPGSANGRQK